jgi:hypothetical protein
VGSERAFSGPLRACYPCLGADLVQARACEEAVFGRQFGNTAEELSHEYAPYEGSTTFGAVFAPDGTALGAVRLVGPGHGRVKTLVDASRPPWSVAEGALHEALELDETRTWDVATLAVDRVAAGADRRIAPALLSVMFGALTAGGATTFVATLDSTARRTLEGLGMRLFDLPGAKPAPYLGSASSVPVYRHLEDLRSEHADQFPQIHQQVFHGRGIDALEPSPTAPDSPVLLETV